MTVRITAAEPCLVRRIAVDGRLTADEVCELEQTVGEEPRSVVLDLSNLRSADAAGLASLRRLRVRGVAMMGAGLHLAWQIQEES